MKKQSFFTLMPWLICGIIALVLGLYFRLYPLTHNVASDEYEEATMLVLTKVRAAGYACITLWVLEANARARRFYQRAGFAPDGARHVLDDLGGVTEVRYRRTLRSYPAGWNHD